MAMRRPGPRPGAPSQRSRERRLRPHARRSRPDMVHRPAQHAHCARVTISRRHHPALCRWSGDWTPETLPPNLLSSVTHRLPFAAAKRRQTATGGRMTGFDCSAASGVQSSPDRDKLGSWRGARLAGEGQHQKSSDGPAPGMCRQCAGRRIADLSFARHAGPRPPSSREHRRTSA